MTDTPRLQLWQWRQRFIAEHPPTNGIGLIPLSQRKTALVDAADYEKVIRHKWYFYRGSALSHVGSKIINLERFVMNDPPGHRVRLRDGNGLNCRRSNLEVCSRGTSLGKVATWDMPKTSRFKGVCCHTQGKGYTAQIGYKGKKIHIGYFLEEVEAAVARDEKALELYGQDAYLNFPDRTST